MYGLNKATIIGHLGADPELRYTENNTPVVSFSVATNESYKDAQGQLVEKSEWHRVTAWRKLAEVMAEHLHKGSKVYIEGKLETRKYTKDGQDHYSTQIVASEFMFLDSKQSDCPKTDNRRPDTQEPPASQDDDLPF